MQANFWLYLVATFFGGLYAASHMSYRFGAADTASPQFKPKAVSWVMAGGLFAAILGPQLVIFTKDLTPPYLFAVSYIGQAAVRGRRRHHHPDVLPRAGPRARGAAARRAGRSARSCASRSFIVAVVCGVASYALMNLMMTVGAARDVRLRPFGHRCGARHPVACARDVCAELLHRLADPALRRRARDRRGARPPRALGGGRALPASRSRISGPR